MAIDEWIFAASANLVFFSKLPKLALLPLLCNFKWKLNGNNCQPKELEYKFRFVKGLLN